MTVHPQKYAGRSVDDKISDIRTALAKDKHRPYGTVVNMLDEVAWLFNLRGTDIPYNPVFFAYAIVTMDQVFLYVDAAKLSDEVYRSLGKNVTVRPYEDILSGCKEVAGKVGKAQKVRSASLSTRGETHRDSAADLGRQKRFPGFGRCHRQRHGSHCRFPRQ